MQPIHQVDSFTDQAFRGNPAGVCILERDRDDSWMQNVAAEMNVAETAFLRRTEDGWSLRWFTPTVEVDLCGHATLASAHVIWETNADSSDLLRFHTRSGLLTARRENGSISMDFPAEVARPVRDEELEGLVRDLPVQFIGRNRMDSLVEVATAADVRNVKLDLHRLARLGDRGLILTAKSDDPQYDFISRFFAPGAGIDEDPVTGSAHCALAPYWGDRLGKTTMRGYQASTRGGVVGVTVQGDRILLHGTAVTVLRGELLA